MKKLSRKGLRTKLDKLVKEYVKKRDNYTCQRCGKKLEGSNCHGSHVIPVSAGLRWAYDTENIIVLCFHDHINYWHKNPIEASQWFQDKFPERYAYLQQVREMYTNEPIKDYVLEELYNELKSKL